MTEPSRRQPAIRAASSILTVCLLAAGSVRFLFSAVLPATRALTGDFATAFPNRYFAPWRPDFVTDQVLPGWTYGPMLHVLTLPLFLVPRWSMVPAVWAAANLCALGFSFVLVCRLSDDTRRVHWTAVAALGGLWLMFQPLLSCFVMGNIEMFEMMLMLAALVAVRRAQDVKSGVFLGVAAMIKFLPVGFIGWLILRKRWRAAGVALAVVAAIATATALTAGWKSNVTFRLATEVPPLSGLHELSVTSLFLHWAGIYDSEILMVRWFPPARFLTAKLSGEIASVLLATALGVVLLVRRRATLSTLEISVLFMAMFMILPWNHDYYYIFSLVPLSILWLRGWARRDRPLLVLTVAAYLLISPPLPFSWIDRTHGFAMPFAYVLNFLGVPILGALLLWLIATYQMLSEDAPAASARVKAGVGASRRQAAGALIMIVGPLACGATFFLLTAPPRDAGVYVEVDRGSHYDVYPLSGTSDGGPEPARLSPDPSINTLVVPVNRLVSFFIAGRPSPSLADNAASVKMYMQVADPPGSSAPDYVPLPTSIHQVNPGAYRLTSDQLGWPGGRYFPLFQRTATDRHYWATTPPVLAIQVGRLADGSNRIFAVRMGPPE